MNDYVYTKVVKYWCAEQYLKFVTRHLDLMNTFDCSKRGSCLATTVLLQNMTARSFRNSAVSVIIKHFAPVIFASHGKHLSF